MIEKQLQLNHMNDLIVIGAGSGGLAAAKRAANIGKKVVLVENDTIGGTCVSFGCVPKKLWHAISAAAHQIEIAKEHGWSIPNSLFSWDSIQPQLKGFIQTLNHRHETKCTDVEINVVRGTASFISQNEIMVNDQVLMAKHILVAVGSKAKQIEVSGYELSETSYEFFSWKKQPSSIVIWGGGYIAVEIASILNALGTEVHLVIRQPYVLRGFDQDMREFLQSQYIKRGINIYTEDSIQSINEHSGQKTVHLKSGRVLNVDKVLQALGRTPNTDHLNLDKIGCECAENGAIIVNDNYSSNVSTVSAVGDCIDKVQLTPVAIAQARQWVDLFYLKKPFPVDFNCIPTAVFSHPEAATIGLSEDDARNQFESVFTKILSFNPLTLALTKESKEPVFMKLVMQGEHQQIIGIHLVSEAAAEIIQSLAIGFQKGLTKADLDLTMALHPTIIEELVTIY